MDPGFDELYYSHYTAILRGTLVLAATPEDAHDAVQEAFARALARWPDVSRLENPGAWVRHVAINAAIDHRRSARSRLRAYRRLLGRGPEPVAAADAASVDVVRALRRLKPSHRQAIVLHYLMDLPVAEIADLTGKPEGTVKTDLARGRAALARELDEPKAVVADV